MSLSLNSACHARVVTWLRTAVLCVFRYCAGCLMPFFASSMPCLSIDNEFLMRSLGGRRIPVWK